MLNISLFFDHLIASITQYVLELFLGPLLFLLGVLVYLYLFVHLLIARNDQIYYSSNTTVNRNDDNHCFLTLLKPVLMI